jgi:serralysin
MGARRAAVDRNLLGDAGDDLIEGYGDVIGDFVHGSDRIDIRGLGFSSFAQLQTAFSQVGTNGAINLGNGDFVVLQNVTMSTLTSGDFILG